MAPMSEPSGGTIRIPRWIQLVGLPVLFIVAFMLARPLGHVIFLFLAAAVIAFTLNPLVRDLQRLRLPRGLSVGVVYVLFVAAIVAVLIGIGTIAVDQTRTAGERIDTYVTEESAATGKTGLQEDVDRLQSWLNDHGLENVKIEKQVDDWIGSLGAGEISGYVQDALVVRAGRGAVGDPLPLRSHPRRRHLDLHAPCHAAAGADDRRKFPPLDGLPLTQRIERALWGYVKGQTILSLVIGTSAGVGMWLLGTTGLVDGRGALRAPVRVVDGVHRGDPLHRPLALGGATRDLRALRRPVGPGLGGSSVPVHLPGRGPHRGAERDGHRAAAASAARHLRTAGRRSALRHPGHPRGAADDGRHARDLGVLRRAGRPSSPGTSGPGCPCSWSWRRSPKSSRSSRRERSAARDGTSDVPFRRGELPAHQTAAPAADGLAACARARDIALARRRRHAALRLPRRGGRAAGRRPGRDSAALGRRDRARGRGAAALRRACSAPVRDPRGEGRVRARAPGTTTGSSSVRCGRSAPRRPASRC